MITLYSIPHRASVRSAQSHILKSGLPFAIRNLAQEPLKLKELHTILYHTQNGFADILSERSEFFKELKQRGIDVEELTVKQLYEYIRSNPTLLRLPILLTNNNLLVGYSHEEYSAFFSSRSEKMNKFDKILSKVRKSEEEIFAETGRFPTGNVK